MPNEWASQILQNLKRAVGSDTIPEHEIKHALHHVPIINMHMIERLLKSHSGAVVGSDDCAREAESIIRQEMQGIQLFEQGEKPFLSTAGYSSTIDGEQQQEEVNQQQEKMEQQQQGKVKQQQQDKVKQKHQQQEAVRPLVDSPERANQKCVFQVELVQDMSVLSSEQPVIPKDSTAGDTVFSKANNLLQHFEHRTQQLEQEYIDRAATFFSVTADTATGQLQRQTDDQQLRHLCNEIAMRKYSQAAFVNYFFHVCFP